MYALQLNSGFIKVRHTNKKWNLLHFQWSPVEIGYLVQHLKEDIVKI